MKKSTFFLYILTAFFFVSVLILAYLNYFSSSKIPSTAKPIDNPSILPTKTVNLTISPSITSSPLSLSNLKTYTGQDFVYLNNIYSAYTFNYPDFCTLKDDTLSCTLKNSLATIQINAGGHGGGEGNYQVLVDNQSKIFNSIEGKLTAIEDLDNKTVFGTYWINKTPKLTQEPIFGFEFYGLSSSDFNEFKTLFEQLLSTFKFTENTTPFSSQDLNQGWYWGLENQKKINTPTDWVFAEAGKSSCWHSPDKNCNL
ncbi:MAG TPA: hypothetical protein VN174_00485 [Candidatus Methanoperedens sp.]|nr:hypothetical protein [Candidatus Methanoperedens sp.]